MIRQVDGIEDIAKKGAVCLTNPVRQKVRSEGLASLCDDIEVLADDSTTYSTLPENASSFIYIHEDGHKIETSYVPKIQLLEVVFSEKFDATDLFKSGSGASECLASGILDKELKLWNRLETYCGKSILGISKDLEVINSEVFVGSGQLVLTAWEVLSFIKYR